MRPIDPSVVPRSDARDAACGDGTPDATQFGDSLRAAARKASPAEVEPVHEESFAARSTPAPHASPASPQAPARAPAPASRAPMTPRDGDARIAAGEIPASTAHADATRARTNIATDAHDERPRAHGPNHDRTPQRNVRKHADTTRPPEGVALQTLLAAAHPLLAGASDTVAAPTPSTLTPHDVAASVTQAWLREPSAQDVAGIDRNAQWTFTLGDPLTPLAALRISGDAAAGWGLQLTAGNGLPARDLAAYTERLRRRLLARGQAVDRLEVDDDPQR